ncbi:MAG: Thioesterase [Mycobacterium sp.]|nr:Thioesterase [Mycobacterium sp.]
MSGSTPKLYIFPHAGGSAEFYVPFAKTFTTDVKRVAVSYPSRRGSHDLSSFSSIPELADQVWGKLSRGEEDSAQVALFGHSMGALVAFEVARRFEQAGNPVAALFVSACAAPGRVGYDHVPDTDRGLLAAVTEFTGVNPDFLQDEDFAAHILPTLRGLKAIAKYECPPDAAVSCPIYAFVGDADDVATAEKVAGWADRTSAGFTVRVFGGHHFYLTDHLRELVEDIEAKLWACCAGGRPGGPELGLG